MNSTVKKRYSELNSVIGVLPSSTTQQGVQGASHLSMRSLDDSMTCIAPIFNMASCIMFISMRTVNGRGMKGGKSTREII